MNTAIWILVIIVVALGAADICKSAPLLKEDILAAKILALQQRQFADTLRGLAHYKRHLQEQGLINHVTDLEVAGNPQFDEVEALQLIPLIINQEEDHRISDKDQIALAKVYGPIWQLIVDEADRRRNRRDKKAERTEMDSVLRSILRAQQVRRYGDQHALNRRSSGLVGNNKDNREPFASHLAVNWDERNLNVEPAQRILKMAAVLIQEQLQEKQDQRMTKQPRKVSKRLAKALREAVKLQRRLKAEAAAMATVQPALVQRRKRRSIGALEADLNDGQISMLRSLMSDDAEEDYDYENYLEEEDQEVDEPQRQATDDNSDYDGYAFDMTHALVEDDDALLRRMYGAPRRSQRNEGSILELFKIAAQHRMRSERHSSDYNESH